MARAVAVTFTHTEAGDCWLPQLAERGVELRPLTPTCSPPATVHSVLGTAGGQRRGLERAPAFPGKASVGPSDLQPPLVSAIQPEQAPGLAAGPRSRATTLGHSKDMQPGWHWGH